MVRLYHQHNSSIHMTDGVTVMSLSASLLQKITVAMVCLCHIMLNWKLLHKTWPTCRFVTCSVMIKMLNFDYCWWPFVCSPDILICYGHTQITSGVSLHHQKVNIFLSSCCRLGFKSLCIERLRCAYSTFCFFLICMGSSHNAMKRKMSFHPVTVSAFMKGAVLNVFVFSFMLLLLLSSSS